MLAGAEAARGACTAPELLPLVDAAFTRPGGPAAHRLVDEVCPTCPISRECLTTALDSGEHGVWGGANERIRRRYVKRSPAYNLRAVDHKMVDGRVTATSPVVRHGRAPDRRQGRMAELGTTSAAVRAWAKENDIPVIPRGLPSMDVIDAFAGAQR